MTNAVIYARYSSDKQNEMSIEGQIEECRKYAEENDLIVLQEYVDRALTATSDKRPNFLRMIDDSRERNFEKKICPGCIHCGACMAVCQAGAIYREEETGLILNDREKCTGCRMCESVCPRKVIFFDPEGKMEKCDGCIDRLCEGREPACVRACSMDAITWSR